MESYTVKVTKMTGYVQTWQVCVDKNNFPNNNYRTVEEYLEENFCDGHYIGTESIECDEKIEVLGNESEATL
jgi:hypothetical protein